MRRLGRWDDDAGTVAVFVAVLMTLFLTVVSLVVDVGRLFDEHAQLRAGADAAVLAVAAECARVPGGCSGTARELVEAYVADNARDGRTTVEDVALTDGGDRGSVTVRVRSLAVGGGDVPLSRPRADGDTAPVRAAATAVWAPVRGATTVPMAIGLCDWYRALAAQGGYLDGPAPAGAAGTIVPVHETDPGMAGEDEVAPAPSPECVTADGTLPGGFVDLRDGTACAATTSWDTNRWLAHSHGKALGRLRGCLRAGAVLAVPLFDASCAPGETPCAGTVSGSFGVHLVGYGAFLVTGWRLPGGSSSDPPTCPATETPPARCLSGFFTRTVLAGAPVAPDRSGPAPFGVSSVQLVPTHPTDP